MISKPYRYRPASGRGYSRRCFEADSLRELGELIAAAEREAGFRTKIFNDAGVLIAPPGTSRIALKTAVISKVGRARQDHFAHAAAAAGEIWSYAPANPGRDVISAQSWAELAKKVAVWGVRTFVGVTQDSREVLGAIEEVVSGRILRDGREVAFHEALRDPVSVLGKGSTLETATLFFELVDRAMLQCKMHDDEIKRQMSDKASGAVQYLVDVRERCGIVERVLKDAADDDGKYHPHVAIIGVGMGAARCLGVARGRTESDQEYAARAELLVGKEVEFERGVDDGWLFGEVPRFAKGLSAAARQRRHLESALSR